MNSKTFLKSLPPIYWSKHHPSSYTCVMHGRPAGLGLIAAPHPAAWNLVHDKFDWSVPEGHVWGIQCWTPLKLALEAPHQGYPLGETVVFLGPKKWPTWWLANRAEVQLTVRAPIDHVMGLKVVVTQ